MHRVSDCGPSAGRESLRNLEEVFLSSGAGTQEAAALSARLAAWHDAMVAHERRLRAGTTSDACDDECPHAEARGLWSEAVATFGPRAQELTFLRSRAGYAAVGAHCGLNPAACSGSGSKSMRIGRVRRGGTVETSS